MKLNHKVFIQFLVISILFCSSHCFASSQLFADGFESGNYSKWSAVSLSESITTDNCRSGNYCSKVDFTAATDGKTVRLASPPIDEFYVSYYFRVDDNYHLPFLGFKWMRLKHGNTDGIQTEFFLNSGSWYSTGHSYQTGAGGLDFPNTGWSWNPSFDDGQWHHVEVYGKYNTGGVANGICRIWFDGVQRLNDTAYTWRTGSWTSDVFANFSITSNAGDGTHRPVAGDIIYIDDVEIWDGMPDSTPPPVVTIAPPFNFQLN